MRLSSRAQDRSIQDQPSIAAMAKQPTKPGRAAPRKAASTTPRVRTASKRATTSKRTRTATAVRSRSTTKSIASVTALIELAVELAVEAHRGQTDKYNQPYILHVLGVAGRCRSTDEKIVAFLHDVVEDTSTTCDDLLTMGFDERIVQAVDCLTRRKGENYRSFVLRIAPNPLARAVKLADLEDNMDVRRSNRPMNVKDAARMEKYRNAWQLLADLHVRDSAEA